MLLKNFQVERILVELRKILLPLETHEYCVGIFFTIFVINTTYSKENAILSNHGNVEACKERCCFTAGDSPQVEPYSANRKLTQGCCDNAAHLVLCRIQIIEHVLLFFISNVVFSNEQAYMLHNTSEYIITSQGTKSRQTKSNILSI